METKLTITNSLLWMIQRVKEDGEFIYEDWADEFRPEGTYQDPRDDKTFYNHLAAFKEKALGLFKGSENVQLLTDKGRYYLDPPKDLDDLARRFEKILSPKVNNFLPLLHALNAHSSILPFPSDAIEKEIIKGLDLDQDTLGRVIYKNAFTPRFKPAFLDQFFDAVHRKTKLLVTPDEDRAPSRITPLLLVNYEGCWYLMGFYKGVCQYNLSRVLEMEVTDEPADAIRASQLENLRRSAQKLFGASLITGEDSPLEGRPVTIRYRGYARMFAKERFDRRMKTETGMAFVLEDHETYSDVTLRVNVDYEAVSEALRWGVDAEIVSPPEYREAWLDRISELAEQFL